MRSGRSASASDGWYSIARWLANHSSVRRSLHRAYDTSRCDDSDQASTFTVELVVDPECRGAGIGAALAREVRGQVEGTVEAWAHGDHPGARRLAETYGLTAVRDLYRLKRGLRGSSDLPLPVDLAEGLEIRPFEQNRDENGWLRVNAQAFSDHPEQGRMTLDDLREREAEE